MRLCEPRTSYCWGLALRYAWAGKTRHPIIVGRLFDDGPWHGCCARTYETREQAREAARRCKLTAPRSDGFKVLLTPIRLRITVEEWP